MSAAEVIDKYEKGARLLTLAVEGITPEQATQRVAPGNWSIAELVVHLVDSDAVGIDRIKRVIAEENPTLMAYDQDAWTARLHANSMPVDEAVALFAANRRWMTRILRNCTDADFARVGQHTEAGEKSLATLLVGYVGHLDSHLRFLYGKRGTLGTFMTPRYSGD